MTTATKAQPAEPELLHLTPAKIKSHPDNPRRDATDVDDLAASLAAVGLLEPLIVAPPHDGLPQKAGVYYLIAGHRRLAAARKAGLKKLPALLRPDLTTRAAQIEAMVVENTQRSDLTAIEEAEAYQLLLDITPKATQATVAKATGQPRARVSERLRLRKLPTEVQDSIHGGQITLHDALDLTVFADDPDTIAFLQGHVGTTDWRWALTRAKQLRERKLQLAKDVKAVHADGGMTVLDEPPTETWRADAPIVPVNKFAYQIPAITVEDHRPNGACPGRAAYIGRAAIGYFCTQPDLHAPPADPGNPDGVAPNGPTSSAGPLANSDAMAGILSETPAQAAERASREERAAAIAAATEVRLDWWRNVITTGDDHAAWTLLQSALNLVETLSETYLVEAHVSGRDYALILGVDPTHPGLTSPATPDDRKLLATATLEHQQGLTSLAAVAAATAFRIFGGDLELNPFGAAHGQPLDPQEDEPLLSYTAALADAGYVWSGLERDVYGIDAAGRPVAAPDAEADATEDDPA